jgi:hypothetical protein
MVEFDIQSFLAEMREEQRQDHQTLMSKFDRLNDRVSQHETRLVVVENTRNVIVAAIGMLFAALIAGVTDFFFNHVTKRL